MHKTRLSLFYLAGYTIPSGLLLLFAPQVALQLLFSNHVAEYGDVMPRLVGAVVLALAMLVVQTIRLRLDALYTTYIVMRAVLLTCLVGLYFYSRDPLFISLFVVVGLGFVLTIAGYLADRRQMPQGTATARQTAST
ncbi:MAG: hypothetical protein ABI835_18060 [Chloroflexota bacterium]